MLAPTRRSRARQAGYTLLDVMGAVVLIAIFLAGVFYANSMGLRMLSASRETAVASKVLQQRLEQVRTANWVEVTDSTALQTLFGAAADGAAELPGESEIYTVTAWPSGLGPSIQITRAAGGTMTVVTDNTDLVDTPAVRVDVRTTWTGNPKKRTRVRETSTVVANGGLGG